MTLQTHPSEFPYIWGKLIFLFYQCTFKNLSPVLFTPVNSGGNWYMKKKLKSKISCQTSVQSSETLFTVSFTKSYLVKHVWTLVWDIHTYLTVVQRTKKLTSKEILIIWRQQRLLPQVFVFRKISSTTTFYITISIKILRKRKQENNSDLIRQKYVYGFKGSDQWEIRGAGKLADDRYSSRTMVIDVRLSVYLAAILD